MAPEQKQQALNICSNALWDDVQRRLSDNKLAMLRYLKAWQEATRALWDAKDIDSVLNAYAVCRNLVDREFADLNCMASTEASMRLSDVDVPSAWVRSVEHAPVAVTTTGSGKVGE